MLNEPNQRKRKAVEDERKRELTRKRVAKWRSNQSFEDREKTYNDQRLRMAATRAMETDEETNRRKTTDRRRSAAARANVHGQNFKNAALNYDSAVDYHEFPAVQIGAMSVECVHCSALKFPGETPGFCCSKGQIKLPTLKPPPEPLQSLVTGTHPDSTHFLAKIRKYNSCFQMTSFGATREVREPGFMPTFKVQGQVYHLAGSLLPQENCNPQFLQIYFVGNSSEEVSSRCSNMPDLKQRIILPLQELLHEHNIYIRTFKTALENMPSDDYQIIIRPDRAPAGEHERRFNAPTIDEVAVVVVGNQFNQRDIVLQKKSSQLVKVTETHRSYDALQYPLMFWQGEDGYNFGIPKIDVRTGQACAKKVSAMDFYAFRLMVRANENMLLRYRQLFNQFVVDMYAKIETERLLFIRLNQKKLRVDEYVHLKDAMANDARPEELGKIVILPSSFQGSPRHMHEYTQDALTYVRNFGRPELFITFTCNPLWTEIRDHLFPGQSPTDRHDLIARVFKQKLSVLLKLITKCQVFGEVTSWMYTIEWQKRGLPHAHMLIWLKERIHRSEIDNIISAEIPDIYKDPILYEVVTTQMIHGPCGQLNPKSPCMANNNCSKDYPKQLILETQTGRDGYPLYRRRKPEDGGFTAKLKMKLDKEYRELEIDNRWVVPYCPLLSKIFKAHINVESCQSVKAIKYICKYINKGSDQAVFELSNENKNFDEVQQFQLGRYISSNEAIWRIFGFSMHERSPTIVHLSVHLENGQRVYFTEHNLRDKVQSPPVTTLTAFFELCRNDPFARTLLYCDVPKYYVWETANKSFKRRKQGTPVQGYPDVKASDALGRVYTVHPSNAECFYLRMLLHVVRGPASFAELKTIEEEVCETYREACLKRGLLEDDYHWECALQEACATQSAAKARQLFCILLTACSVSNPFQLWEKFKEALSEDIMLELRRENPGVDVYLSDDICNQTMIRLEDMCLTITGKFIDCFGLPRPTRDESSSLNTEVLRELSYDTGELQSFVEKNCPLLTLEQRLVFEEISREVEKESGGIFFLDAPGGTGKTFVINLLLATVRQKAKIAVAVASSGIAATLLEGGRTAHSTFKLPLDIIRSDVPPTCNIARGSGMAKLLQQCKLIVWDECTMAHKQAMEALDRTLRDLRSNDDIMGGVTVVLAGDFRQTLPVLPRSTPADELNACLKASQLWRYVRKLSLTINMRVHLLNDKSAGWFSEQLLALGDGKLPIEPKTGLVCLPSKFCCVVESQETLQFKVFDNVQMHFRNQQWMRERAILAPKNDAVFRINTQLLNLLPTDAKVFKSFDTVEDPTEAIHYPLEFLNSLQPSGLPPHKLELKIGAPIVLLRNLQPPKLCNGTRLTIKNLLYNLIEATIVTGKGAGEDVFIPRIPMLPTDLPFSFRRLQFPVALAFAMTVNKSQGQSFKVVGVDLTESCFAHGQLYVACSRVGNPENLIICAPGGKTKNVVYKQALL